MKKIAAVLALALMAGIAMAQTQTFPAIRGTAFEPQLKDTALEAGCRVGKPCLYWDGNTSGPKWKKADGSLITLGTGGGSSYYQTVEINAVDQTQRDQLNFSSQFSAADSSSPSRTTISIVALAQSVITNLVSDLAAKAATATQIIAGTGLSGGGTLASDRTLTLNVANANTWTASQNVASVALSDGANIATNAALGNVFTVTLGGNRTLDNPTNLVAGGTYQWVVQQDGAGSRTLAYGTTFTWFGGSAPTLSTAASAVDAISCVYYGGTSKLLCAFAGATGGGGSSYYQTVENAGTPLTQRSVLNCDGTGIVCSDDGSETDIALGSTVVTESSTDTLTNKTLTSPVCTTPTITGNTTVTTDGQDVGDATHRVDLFCSSASSGAGALAISGTAVTVTGTSNSIVNLVSGSAQVIADHGSGAKLTYSGVTLTVASADITLGASGAIKPGSDGVPTLGADSLRYSYSYVGSSGADSGCAAAQRGKFRTFFAAGGASDEFRVCMKDAADTYAWRAVYTAP